MADDSELQSHRSDSSTPARPADKSRKSPSLFPNKRVLTREAAKQRLQKILNVKKDSDKHRQSIEHDLEFIILGKIYSELDASVDLAAVALNRGTLSHLLPFLLNTLLYGFQESPGSARSSSTRQAKKSSNLKVTRDPNQITLGGISHLVKAQCERQLETFLYKHSMHSVSFALECLWYLTGSLYLGPKHTYHRTMTLLLGIESVVTNSTPPGDLFKKAEVTPSSAVCASASIPSASPSSDSPISISPNSISPDSVSPASTSAHPTLASHSAIDKPHPLASPASIRAVDLDITGSGEKDLHMQFSSLKGADEVKLQHWLDARRQRASSFHAQLDFVKCLTHISHSLFDVELEFRRDVLRRELEKLNDFIPTNVFIPTDRRPHRVLRIVPEDVHVFSTKERVPYLLVVEVEDLVSSSDRYNVPEEHHHVRPGSPLRRIGTLSPSSKHAGKLAVPDELRNDIPLQNKPGSKFEFSPDVTAEPNSAIGGESKRESSFRVDTNFADDRRPPDEELLKALGERWAVKCERLRKASPFGSNPNWRLVSCIVKARDQLRQEMFAQRLIQEFARMFDRALIPCWLRAYEIISTSSDSGLIETLTDALSIDSIKKHSRNVVTLQDYFVGVHGGRGSPAYKRAVRNFVQSMAGYSIVQYLLNIKDRHNGNLMIDSDGHIIHIDFGFLLSNSPGGNMEFEKSPFKLTNEMVQVMGGTKSGAWKLFRKLCVQGYLEACRYANKVMLMVDTMYPGNESMPCFLQGREYVLENMRERFGVDLTRKERASKMLKLIDTAHGNWTTKAYDQFQRLSLGIAK